MNTRPTYSFVIALLILQWCFFGCSSPSKPDNETEAFVKVEMITDLGTIVIQLYNKTPLHRDNFIKLVKEGQFDSLLFHRVIEEFVIQGGDPDSKMALSTDTLGNGGLDYTIPAELDTTIFHKRGAVGAARDGNPARASSSMQFYIAQGKVANDSLLEAAEIRINSLLAEHYTKNDPVNKNLLDSLQTAIDNDDEESYVYYNDSIRVLAKMYTTFSKYTIPETHRNVYKTLGGIPRLDQNYTVFGEVVKGMDVVDSIAKVEVGAFDRPLKDVRIRSMRIVTE